MEISSYETHQGVDKSKISSNHIAIVIDVLRATSSMVTAVDHGAHKIYPVSRIEDVKKLKTMHPDALLCGEREGVMIPGFDMGNSPLVYTANRIKGKTLLFTTTNGTSAIVKASHAKEVYIASLLNAKAVAEAACDKDCPIVIIMAGTRGNFSLDDALAAGAILHHLGKGHAMDDLSLCCRALYQRYQDDLMEGMKLCHHAKILIDLGFGEDVVYCVQESVIDVVPKYKDGRITL